MSAFVPTKTLRVRKIHSYNDLRKLAKEHFWVFCSSLSSSFSSSVELAYRQSGTSSLNGFFTKRFLSVVCVILDQENLRNFTHFLFVGFYTCICKNAYPHMHAIIPCRSVYFLVI